MRGGGEACESPAGPGAGAGPSSQQPSWPAPADEGAASSIRMSMVMDRDDGGDGDGDELHGRAPPWSGQRSDYGWGAGPPPDWSDDMVAAAVGWLGLDVGWSGEGVGAGGETHLCCVCHTGGGAGTVPHMGAFALPAGMKRRGREAGGGGRAPLKPGAWGQSMHPAGSGLLVWEAQAPLESAPPARARPHASGTISRTCCMP